MTSRTIAGGGAEIGLTETFFGSAKAHLQILSPVFLSLVAPNILIEPILFKSPI